MYRDWRSVPQISGAVYVRVPARERAQERKEGLKMRVYVGVYLSYSFFFLLFPFPFVGCVDFISRCSIRRTVIGVLNLRIFFM